MNIANKLTVSRVVLIPIFLFFFLVPLPFGSFQIGNAHLTVSQSIAGIFFIIATITDWLDGFLARKLHLETNFGKFLDPLADKLLVMSAFVALVDINSIPGWMVIVILAREFAVTGLRLVAVGEGIVLAASKIAKWKTLFQMLACILYLFNNVPFGLNGFPFAYIVLWIAVLMTIISGWDYFYKNRAVIMSSK